MRVGELMTHASVLGSTFDGHIAHRGRPRWERAPSCGAIRGSAWMAGRSLPTCFLAPCLPLSEGYLLSDTWPGDDIQAAGPLPRSYACPGGGRCRDPAHRMDTGHGGHGPRKVTAVDVRRCCATAGFDGVRRAPRNLSAGTLAARAEPASRWASTRARGTSARRALQSACNDRRQAGAPGARRSAATCLPAGS